MKQHLYPGVLLAIAFFFLPACGDSNRENVFKDLEEEPVINPVDTSILVDGFAVKIGSQVWSAKNLDVSTFSNGDPIPQIQLEEDWQNAGNEGKPAWCYFNNDSTSGAGYGKLYNWFAVNDTRGLAPKGWHVASDEEWSTLSSFLGGDDIAGIKLKSDSGWANNGNGSDAGGFKAYPGGYRYFAGLFLSAGSDGGWWTSTPHSNGYAWVRYLYSKKTNIFRNHLTNSLGFSVRCVKN